MIPYIQAMFSLDFLETNNDSQVYFTGHACDIGLAGTDYEFKD